MTSFTSSAGGKDLSDLSAFKLLNDYTHITAYCNNRPIACFFAKRWLMFENAGIER